MIGLLSNIVFLYPWILIGGIILPILWILLRVAPPPPQLIALPSARFLDGLISSKQTPSTTPWWILLLRLLIVALVLLALAHPIKNPSNSLPGGASPIRLVIDNSWPSAQSWSAQIKKAKDIIAQAGREGREIYLLTTAPAPGKSAPLYTSPLTPKKSLSIIDGLVPLPWPADYKNAKDLLSSAQDKDDITNIWLSHGINEGEMRVLTRALQEQGQLHYYAPNKGDKGLFLTLPEINKKDIVVDIIAPSSYPHDKRITVQAITEDGSVIDEQDTLIDPDENFTPVKFNIPDNLTKEIFLFKIKHQKGAGAIVLLDNRHNLRNVGIVTPKENKDTPRLATAGYYLKRALEPHAKLNFGSFQDVLSAQPSVIILPDIATIPTDVLNDLETWVQDGGLLLRFAGPNMAETQNKHFLTPVQLRRGERSLSGAMTWEKPSMLAPFPEHSPFYGIEIPDEITIKQQLLAQPSIDLEEKTWASLGDGTPLITATTMGHGMLVMVHTTVEPQWSNLPLSGVFVDILKQILELSKRQNTDIQISNTILEPLKTLDGFGNFKAPPNYVRPILANNFTNIRVTSSSPPGIYEQNGQRRVLNTGAHLSPLQMASKALNPAIKQYEYEDDGEYDLMPALLYIAFILLLCDWLIMIIIASGMRPFGKVASVILLISLYAPNAYAQDLQSNMRYANGFHLAYIKTGNPSVDATAKSGLDGLATALKRRTSIEVTGVAALNPDIDELSFFPLIYWPLIPNQKELSPNTLSNVQRYLNYGGTILFDTRDQNRVTGHYSNTQNALSLRAITASLNVPPLEPIPNDHVLGRSFYLLSEFPGRFKGGTLWVEKKQKSQSRHDGVSSILIGSHDWASAWALSPSTSPRQQEMARRFGINLVMYALTGNYKTDQVHIPSILERLGQ